MTNNYTRPQLYGLTDLTADIVPGPDLNAWLEEYNRNYIYKIASTAECYWLADSPYVQRKGATPYRTPELENLYMSGLGYIPTYKSIAGNMLLPQKGTLPKVDTALHSFDSLPLLDRLFLLALNTCIAHVDSKRFMDGNICCPDILSQHVDTVNIGQKRELIPGEKERAWAKVSYKGKATEDYLLASNSYPVLAQYQSIYYPSTARVVGMCNHDDFVYKLVNTGYISLRFRPELREYSSALGRLPPIDTETPVEPVAPEEIEKDDDKYERVLWEGESGSLEGDKYDDNLPSATMINAIYSHSLLCSRKTSMHSIYTYLHNLEQILRSIQNLVNTIYCATLREARESNGERITILDFFGKHNLFDVRAALFLHRLKEDSKNHNCVTMWYNICTACRYLEAQLKESGVKNGGSEFFGNIARRDLLLFLVDDKIPDVQEFIDSVEAGNTGVLKIADIPNEAESSGMQNSLRHKLMYNAPSDTGSTYISTDIEINKLDSVEKSRRVRHAFDLHGLPGLAGCLSRLNKNFKSSLILKRHDAPFLKSLHSIFMRYISDSVDHGFIKPMTDFDAVRHQINDTTVYWDIEGRGVDRRDFFTCAEFGNNVSWILNTIPDSIQELIAPLTMPTLLNDQLDFTKATPIKYPNNNVVRGISFQSDILQDYDFQHDAIPNVWPPSSYSYLPNYTRENGDTCASYHGVFELFSFINSSRCKSGPYSIENTPYGSMFNLNVSYAARGGLEFYTTADDQESPSAAALVRSNDAFIDNDNVGHRIPPVQIRTENGIETRNCWHDRGINVIAALTYQRTPIIPLSLSVDAVYPTSTEDFESSLISRNITGTELAGRVIHTPLASLLSMPLPGLIFSVDAKTGESSVNMDINSLDHLHQDLKGLAHGIGAVGTVLNDYLLWRSNTLPDDTRFLNLTVKLRDLCCKYSSQSYVDSLFLDIISQALNGDSIHVLEEV